MKTIALVNTPLQAVSASCFLDERRLCRSNSALVVLVPTGNESNIIQTRETAELLKLPHHTLTLLHGPYLINHYCLLRQVRTLIGTMDDSDILAIGNPTYDLFKDACARSKSANIWILDDGLRTITFIDDLLKKVDPFHKKVATTIRSQLKEKIYSYEAPSRTDVKVYSIFSRLFNCEGALYFNDLKYLKAISQFGANSKEVVFLSQPLVSTGVLSLVGYQDLCSKIIVSLRRSFPDGRLVYLGHRNDGKDEESVSSMFDEYRPSTGPVELQWLKKQTIPLAICGFTSTALFTLSTLLGHRAKVICFWPEHTEFSLPGGRMSSALKKYFYVARNQEMFDLTVI